MMNQVIESNFLDYSTFLNCVTYFLIIDSFQVKSLRIMNLISLAVNLASVGVGLSSLVGVGPCEHKDVSSQKLLETNSIDSVAEEVKITGIPSVAISKDNSGAPLPVEPVRTSDTVVTGGSPPRGVTQGVQGNCSFYLLIKHFLGFNSEWSLIYVLLSLVSLVCLGVKASVRDEIVKFHKSEDASTVDMIPEQKEGTTSIQFSSDLFKSVDKEAKLSASSSLTKSDGKVNRLLAGSDIGENIPFNSTTNPQSALTEQPSSCVGSSVASHVELQSLKDNSITHEEAKAVGRSLVNHDSSVNGEDKADVSEASSHEDKETAFGISGNFIVTEFCLFFNQISLFIVALARLWV